MDVKVVKLFFVILSIVSIAVSFPQQPRWNWEEVILSRNGPSTTTSPRPKTWTTTTLRSFDVAPVKGEGSVGTVEDANIIPGRKLESHREQESNSVSVLQPSIKIVAFVICLLRLI
jgi:hypothetical protein